MGRQFSNWSGHQRFVPRTYVEAGTLAQVVEAVGTAVDDGRKVRVAGNGHSFSEIVRTDDTLITLRALSGVIDADVSSGLVRVRAGTSIYNLSRMLDKLGLALPNLGDIDVQAIAGAASTGTHGTGERFFSVSPQIMAAQIVTANGDVIEVDESDASALKAARVSLGALGVITEVTLQCVPRFTLDRLDLPRPLSETYETFDELSANCDHFEYYIFPYTDRAIQKRINRVDRPPAPMPAAKKFFNEVIFENWTLQALVGSGRMFPNAIPGLARAATKTFSPVHHVDKSFQIFSTVRNVRFNEMEYAVPRENLREAVERVMAVVEEHQFPVNFPIEVRVGAADHECLLATAAGRDSGYISVHMHTKLDYEPYFRAVEAIMDGYAGRPHWGKINWQTADKLAPRYDGWDEFQAVRAKLDPQGVFTNEYVERVLGPVTADRAA